MSARVLIVEDEILVAADMEATLEEFGHVSVGIAPDTATARRLVEREPDLAFVDVNLRDGRTGPDIGAMLSRRGVTVIFLTANPRLLGPGVPGALGVLSKPCDEDCLAEIVAFALSRRRGEQASAPSALTLFPTA